MTTFKIKHGDGGYTEVTTAKPMSARNLDGIYYRAEVEGEWCSRCLTDLPADIVEELLLQGAGRAPDPTAYMMAVVRHLHGMLRDLGDQFDLTSN